MLISCLELISSMFTFSQRRSYYSTTKLSSRVTFSLIEKRSQSKSFLMQIILQKAWTNPINQCLTERITLRCETAQALWFKAIVCNENFMLTSQDAIFFARVLLVIFLEIPQSSLCWADVHTYMYVLTKKNSHIVLM